MKTLISKVLSLLKMGLNFVGSVHNIGKSDDDKYLFSIDALVVWCPIWSKKLGRTLMMARGAFLTGNVKPLGWHLKNCTVCPQDQRVPTVWLLIELKSWT